MNPEPNDPGNNERIGRLEASMEAFQTNVTNELNEIRSSLRDILRSMNKSRETNWGVILAGVAVAGSLYASAIRPLNVDLARQEDKGKELAIAVLEKDRAIAATKEDIVKLKAEAAVLQAKFQAVYDHGSPITDKRLALIELQLQQIQKPKP